MMSHEVVTTSDQVITGYALPEIRGHIQKLWKTYGICAYRKKRSKKVIMGHVLVLLAVYLGINTW
jgi:hypothetical protein